MPYRPFEGQHCSIARTLAIVGERWTLLVLREVLLGRRHYAEIRRETGVATNILADRLETMVQHGILEVDADGAYRATPKGLDLQPVLIALMEWGDAHAGEPPPRVLVHTRCGHDTRPEYRCSHCGEPVPPQELRARPGPGATEQMRAAGVLPAG
ncbi:MAG: helix-turn-helix transcriptional regulator [Solirubrobacterales bacterium]|nr:helix-turn-helix transcriptional regulator [Solirubrobacterales bacterium]